MGTSTLPDRLRLSKFELDLRTGEIFHNGRRQLLQDQPLQVLKMLLERPGELVTREELQRRLWPADTFVDFDHGLNKAVGKLRDALSVSGQPCDMIETLPRRGYRFVGPVEPLAKPEDSRHASTGLPADAAPAPAKAPGPAAGHRTAWTAGGAAAILVMVLAIVSYLNVGGLRTRLFPSARPIHSIAVLQMRNLSGSPDQDFFAEGFTDELTTNLARISSLRVVSALAPVTLEYSLCPASFI